MEKLKRVGFVSRWQIVGDDADSFRICASAAQAEDLAKA